MSDILLCLLWCLGCGLSIYNAISSFNNRHYISGSIDILAAIVMFIAINDCI